MARPILPKDQWAILLDAERCKQQALREEQSLRLRLRKHAYKQELERQADLFHQKHSWEKFEDMKYLQHAIQSGRKEQEQERARRMQQIENNRRLVEENLKLAQEKHSHKALERQSSWADSQVPDYSEGSRGSERSNQNIPRQQLVRSYQKQIRDKQRRRRQQEQRQKQTEQVRRQLEQDQERHREQQMARLKEYGQDRRVYEVYENIRRQQLSKSIEQERTRRAKVEAEVRQQQQRQQQEEETRRLRVLSYKQGLQNEIERKARQRLEQKAEASRPGQSFNGSEQNPKGERNRVLRQDYIRGLRAQLAERQQKLVLGKYMTEDQLRMNKGSLARAAVGYLNEGLDASPLQIGRNRDERQERLIDRSLGLNVPTLDRPHAQLGGLQQQHLLERLHLN